MAANSASSLCLAALCLLATAAVQKMGNCFQIVNKGTSDITSLIKLDIPCMSIPATQTCTIFFSTFAFEQVLQHSPAAIRSTFMTTR